MTLSQGHDTIVWKIIQIQHDSKELRVWHGFWLCVYCTLTLQVWSSVKSMTCLWLWTTIFWIYYQEPIWQRSMRSYGLDMDFWYVCTWPWWYDLGSRPRHALGPWTTIVWITCNITIQLDSKDLRPGLGMCALWPWPRRYDLETRSWHTLVSSTTIVWNTCTIQIQLGSEDFLSGHRPLDMCALWPWPLRYDLGSRSCHTPGSCTTIVWNIQIQLGSEELWPGPRVHCDLKTRSWHTCGSWTSIVWKIIQIQLCI